MTPNRSTDDLRTDIDERLQGVLDADGSGYLADVVGPPTDHEDRWYGRLVVASADAVAPDADRSTLRSAATAVELLREYYRLRTELLVQVTERTAHSLNHDPTEALLAGDFLFAASFASLESIDASGDDSPFEALTAASRSIVEALGRIHVHPEPAPADLPAHFDDTVGALGRAAAVLGASLGGADDDVRRRFATVGRGFAVVRRIERLLERDEGAATIVPPTPDPDPLDAHAANRLRDADAALRGLSGTIDVDALGPLREWDDRSR